MCGQGKQSHGERSSRINKVHEILDLWRRPIDQLVADCCRHSTMPTGIITKSELRQNYRITEDKLQCSTLAITVAPPRRSTCVREETRGVFCLLQRSLKCAETQSDLRATRSQSGRKRGPSPARVSDIKTPPVRRATTSPCCVMTHA